MINFRYHLVSLIAVFLALTLGIALGATVVDKALVDQLKHRITKVENESEATDKRSDLLTTRNRELERYVNDTANAAVEGRMTGVPVVVFAERGIDRNAAKSLVTLLQQAGADAPSIVWLEPKWNLATESARRDLADALGVDTITDPKKARASALTALTERFATPPADEDSATTPTTVNGATRSPGDVFDALVSAHFIAIEGAGPGGSSDLKQFPGPGARAVLVVGDGASDLPSDLPSMLAGSLDTASIPTTVGAYFVAREDGPARGVALEGLRKDAKLSRRISTVDDLDLVEGRVAVVLVSNALAGGNVGHYGYGEGSSSRLPAS